MRGRFAPTPSGLLHIGNARTALLAWLQVRQAGGQFLLRMEDIDRPRSRADVAEQILVDLRWLGLHWDEGPDVGGPVGPYTQNGRLNLYEEALERLEAKGLLYPCFCSRAELLAVASAPHGLASEGPAYPGTCRSLSPAERAAKALTKQPSLRFRMPDEGTAFDDLAQGAQSFPGGAGGDFVVRRADGIWGYQLAVVLDDGLMGITDVLRGADLLDSTPRQIRLFEALGLPVPRFAHVPLLLGPDGARLAKRHGAVSVTAMRAAGTAPERVIGYLGFISGLLDRPEPVTAAELVPLFDLAKVGREPVQVEPAHLAALTGGLV
ncbi:MAG TPA: tRNA glutamyl-Q(34) synthetase GluQRS [Symbiobacteriaceae bacterium]|nr:tRNA glutamyl-Q(34) synthetase GluQRS [Symbiobacteriaceae bacterium]